MRLLLTRAQPDADRTRVKLEALGHHVVVSPVIDIVGTGAIWPPGVVDAALATSGHAFSVRIDGPPPEVRRLLPLYLVGARTQELARVQGFLGPAIVAKTAAALSMEIGKVETRPKRLVYLAGRDRKPDLETALEGIGQELDVLEVYEARPSGAPTVDAARAFRHKNLDAILHFSRRSATLFLEIASAQGLDIRSLGHVCLSDDVAAPLREAGFDDVIVADQPTENSLLALLPADDPQEAAWLDPS